MDIPRFSRAISVSESAVARCRCPKNVYKFGCAKSGALSCLLMHSCSAMDRHMQHSVFHTIAFLAFSCLTFSTPETWCRIFMSRKFMSRIFSVPICLSVRFFVAATGYIFGAILTIPTPARQIQDGRHFEKKPLSRHRPISATV